MDTHIVFNRARSFISEKKLSVPICDFDMENYDFSENIS